MRADAEGGPGAWKYAGITPVYPVYVFGLHTRKLFADIADAGDIIEIHIIESGQPDQGIHRNTAASCLVVRVRAGRYFYDCGDLFLCEMVLRAELEESGPAGNAHDERILSMSFREFPEAFRNNRKMIEIR